MHAWWSHSRGRAIDSVLMMTRRSPLHCHLALVHVIPPLHLVICEVYSLLVHLLAHYYCNVVRVVLFDLTVLLDVQAGVDAKLVI